MRRSRQDEESPLEGTSDLVRDLGSTNGTRVNGQRIRRAALLPNDQFSVANFKYRVIFEADVPAAPAAVGKAPITIRVNDLPDVIAQRT